MKTFQSILGGFVVMFLVTAVFAMEHDEGFVDVGPILLMPLNESEGATTFYDASGNNYDGSCSGVSCPARGDFGLFSPALTFDGTNDVIGGISMGAAGTSDWTVSAWVRTTDTSAGMVLSNRATEPERSMSLHVGWWAGAAAANGNVYFSNDGPTCEWGARGSTDISNGNFHHIVGVRASLGTYRVYVNGTLEGTTNQTVGTGCQNASASSTSDWMIGDGPAWVGSEWVGQIGEVTVYNSALSARAIHHLFRAQRRRFSEFYNPRWRLPEDLVFQLFPLSPQPVADPAAPTGRRWLAYLH